MHTRRLGGTSLWGTLAVLLALAGLAACGGGSTEDGGEQPYVGQLPDNGGTPGTTPGGGTPGGGTPPADPPADPPDDPPTEPPVDPPEEPPVEPPVEPPPPPGSDRPPPPEPLSSFEGFESVQGVALDAESDTWYAIASDEGRLIRWDPIAGPPVILGAVGVDGFTALAFVPTEGALYAVRKRDAGDAELYRLTAEPPAAELVGEITGYAQIEGLTWHGPAEALFAVDAGLDALIRFDPTTPGAAEAIADLEGVDAPVALASDPEGDVLYVHDEANADVVQLGPVTGTARRMATLLEGPMLGMAFHPGTRRFLAASPGDGHLRVLDPMGERFEMRHVHALVYDAAAGILYGSYMPNGLLLRIEPDSGWRQALGYHALPRVEGLAAGGPGGSLYALSRTRRELYVIQPATMKVVTVGTIQDAAGTLTWTGLSSLARVGSRLVTVDRTNGAVLDIDPATAVGMLLTTLSPEADVRSLAFDADASLLHAVGNFKGAHFVLKPSEGWAREERSRVENRKIGGLAWVPAAVRLIGSELEQNALVSVAPLEASGLPYDAIQALALRPADDQLLGYDPDAGDLVVLRPESPDADLLAEMGAEIFALAYAEDLDVYLAADAATATLWRIAPSGAADAVGGGGTLGATVLHALAYDATNSVLWGVDRDSRRLVTIDVGTGVATVAFPTLPELPFDSIEALAWDPDTGALVAVDRSTRQLIEIDPATGTATAYAEIELPAVTGAAIGPGTGELLLIDTKLDLVMRVDRFTGDVLTPFDPLAIHRGLDNDNLVSLHWPRGALRVGGWNAFAIEVSELFEPGGTLVFKRGEEVLFEQPFEPKNIFTLQSVPAAVTQAAKPGDVITWGLTSANGDDVTVDVTVVDRPEVATDLKALAAIPSLQEAQPWVRAACVARILSRHGLHTEAVETLRAASDLPQDVPGILRAFVTSLRGLECEDGRIQGLIRTLYRK